MTAKLLTAPTRNLTMTAMTRHQFIMTTITRRHHALHSFLTAVSALFRRSHGCAKCGVHQIHQNGRHQDLLAFNQSNTCRAMSSALAWSLRAYLSTLVNPSDLSNMFAHGDMVEATVERVGSDGKIYLTMRENSRLSAKVCNVIAHIQWQRKFRRIEFQHRQAYERRRW